MILEAPIEHKQLYAQLKQEVIRGERDYLNKEEEKEVQRRNKAYYRQSPLEDIFYASIVALRRVRKASGSRLSKCSAP